MGTEKSTPTLEQYGSYQGAFDHFNEHVFGGTVPEAMLTIGSSGKRSKGYIEPKRWQKGKKRIVHEICLSPELLREGLERTMGQIVALMGRLYRWQEAVEDENRTAAVTCVKGYVDARLATIFEDVGLRVAGEKQAGVWNPVIEVVEGGEADQAIKKLPRSARLPWLSLGDLTEEEEVKPKGRVKYTCHTCGVTLQGRRGMHLSCTGSEGKEHAQERLLMEDQVPEVVQDEEALPEGLNDSEEVGAIWVDDDEAVTEPTAEEIRAAAKAHFDPMVERQEAHQKRQRKRAKADEEAVDEAVTEEADEEGFEPVTDEDMPEPEELEDLTIDWRPLRRSNGYEGAYVKALEDMTSHVLLGEGYGVPELENILTRLEQVAELIRHARNTRKIIVLATVRGVVHLAKVEDTKAYVYCTDSRTTNWDYGTLSAVTCPDCLQRLPTGTERPKETASEPAAGDEPVAEEEPATRSVEATAKKKSAATGSVADEICWLKTTPTTWGGLVGEFKRFEITRHPRGWYLEDRDGNGKRGYATLKEAKEAAAAATAKPEKCEMYQGGQS